MENIYLKVIENRINPYLSSPDKTQKESCAKALADMNREFTEWFLFEEHQGIFHWNTLSGGGGYTLFHNTNATLDDLFLYWWENIYLKKQSNT